MPCSDTSSHARIYRPLMPLVVALMIGMAGGACRPGYAWAAGGTVMLLCVLLVRNVLKSRPCVILPMLYCALVGYLAIQPWLVAVAPEGHVSRFVGERFWKIRGRVAEPPIVEKNRWRFVLAAEGLEDTGRDRVVSGRVLVSGRGKWPGAGKGDRVAFIGRLQTIRSFANPGGFDYERYLALQAVRARIFAKAGSFKILPGIHAVHWPGRLDRSRARLNGMMDAALEGFAQPTVQLLKALVLGERDQIPDQMRQDFSRAGVGHVLAISGLHIGMVAAVAFGSIRWLLTWIPWMLRRAWTRKGAALISLVPVLGYGMLAGFTPSTQRAVIMVVIFLMAYWVGRRHDRFNTLSLAGLVILVIHPPALLSISFQLSFMAVLAILAGLEAPPQRVPEDDPPLWRRLLRRLTAFMRVSILAVTGTLPLVITYFNHVSLAGPVANLAVVPLVGMLVVPAGLAGVAASWLNADLAALLWKPAALGAEWIRLIAAWTARQPWSAVQCVTPSGVETSLYYLCAAGLLFWRKVPRPKVVFAILLALCVLDGAYWVFERFGRRDLRVTVLDVGQGSANLIEFPGGYTALVDGGGFSDNDAFDVGRQIVAPLLLRKKIRTVDLVVLSHANSDHLNGLLYILPHFRVREVWSNGEQSDSAGFKRWKKQITETGVAHLKIGQIPSRIVRHGVQLQVMAPPEDFRQRSESELWRDLNNNSLVLRICYKDVSVLFTGDIMAPAETELLDRLGSQGLSSTILVVPHHGSRSSSTRPFIEAVQPKEALISAGWRNRFGFPHADVIRRLDSLGIRLWCTAGDGAICIVTNGMDYHITGWRNRL